MSDTQSRIPVAPQSHPHYDYPQNPQYPPPPGVRPDLAFTPVARAPRDTTRRWPSLAMAAAAGAAIAATVAALITSQVVRNDAGHSTAPAVTVTATPDAPAPPAPLPAAQADRQTCNAWLAAGKHVDVAVAALRKLPPGMTIMDSSVRDNADLSALVRTAADAYEQAGDTLAAGIAPGTTVILSQSATAAAAALHAVHTADSTYDAANGNTFHIWQEAASTVNVLCERLAP